MEVLLLGHKPAKDRLRAIARALRDMEGQAVGIDCYFDGDLAALSRNPDRLRVAKAVVFGLSTFSRNEGSAEYLIEQEIFKIVRKAGSALFLLSDEIGIDAPYLKDGDLGRAVNGVFVYPTDRKYGEGGLCPAAYPLHIPDPLTNAKPAAEYVREITLSPGYILPTW